MTRHDLDCLRSSSQLTSMLSQSVRGHFVTVTEVGMHLLTYNPGRIYFHVTSRQPCWCTEQ